MKEFFLACYLLLGIAGTAQQATNFGALKIHAGANLSFFGNYANASTASFVNDGIVYVKRDVESQQTGMSSGAGTLHFNGTALQTVSGTAAFRTFNLVSDNASGILLTSDLVVSGVHTFSNGLITTSSAPNFLLYEAGSSYTGSNDSRHVNGWVKKEGTTDFIFPVGNLSFQREIGIHNLSANSVFSAKYETMTPDTASLLSPIARVDPNEYWQVNRSAGSSARLTLNWDNGKISFPNWSPNDVLVAGYDGGFWQTQGDTATGNPATTGTITSELISNFSRFTFGMTHTALPLTLVAFDARRQNSVVNLSWVSTDEQDIEQYVVQRSNDRRNFISLGIVAARNSASKENYSVIDQTPVINTAYYRLKIIEKSGREMFTQVKQITAKQTEGQVVLVNNPVSNRLILFTKAGQQQPLVYTIHSVNGQQVQHGSISLVENGSTVLPLERKISKGSYILVLHGATTTQTIRFVVQ